VRGAAVHDHAAARLHCINFATGQELAFRFTPTLRDLAIAVAAGALVGGLGGLLPAFRASRISPVQAMRA